MPTRAQIVEAARALQGTPFSHQSINGLDCIGLLRDVGLAVGASPETVAYRMDYARVPDMDEIRRGLISQLVQKPINARRDGDVLLFRDPFRKGSAYHMGIQSPGGFIHATAMPPKLVCEIPLDELWRRAIVGVFEYPGVIDG